MFLLSYNRLPSRTRSYSTGSTVFWFQFWIIPEPPAPVPLDKGSGGCGNEIDYIASCFTFFFFSFFFFFFFFGERYEIRMEKRPRSKLPNLCTIP